MPVIEVVYVSSTQEVTQVELPCLPGMLVADAIDQAGLSQKASEMTVGIFSKLVTFDTPLSPGDRVELYRPLSGDPKEKRRSRAIARK